jgi:beta-phosphoglucomutase-like phosphatase (HAD superfamily)
MCNKRALLFDIDGTLADTDALHLGAFNAVLGPRGHVFDHDRFVRAGGVRYDGSSISNPHPESL